MNGSIGRRYAKALLGIGIEMQTFDSFGKELERMVETFDRSEELSRTLANPIFAADKRRAVLEELTRKLALSKTVRNFIMLLLDKGRIDDLPAISRAYRALVDEYAGRVRARVTTARPLDPALEQRLKSALEKRSGKVVLLEKHEDPSIVGGVVTQLGDTVFDGSVRSQLEEMRDRLLAE